MVGESHGTVCRAGAANTEQGSAHCMAQHLAQAAHGPEGMWPQKLDSPTVDYCYLEGDVKWSICFSA